jgi:hypothetical protein
MRNFRELSFNYICFGVCNRLTERKKKDVDAFNSLYPSPLLSAPSHSHNSYIIQHLFLISPYPLAIQVFLAVYVLSFTNSGLLDTCRPCLLSSSFFTDKGSKKLLWGGRLLVSLFTCTAMLPGVLVVSPVAILP